MFDFLIITDFNIIILMKVVIQRVNRACVFIGGEKHSEIKRGYLLLVGVEEGDSEKDLSYILKKTVNIRIFSNEEGKFDLSVKDVRGEILVISQFTLCADASKGRRPDFTAAAKPAEAENLYKAFITGLMEMGLTVRTGIFGAQMEVELVNDGPVTIILDSREIGAKRVGIRDKE